MNTKDVEMTIALPIWATVAPKKEKKINKKPGEVSETAIGAVNTMCLPQSTWSQSDRQAHHVFARFRCDYVWTKGSTTTPPCYRCSRSAA
jgi:hypothetical protein